jgi:hypothetical protein
MLALHACGQMTTLTNFHLGVKTNWLIIECEGHMTRWVDQAIQGFVFPSPPHICDVAELAIIHNTD